MVIQPGYTTSGAFDVWGCYDTNTIYTYHIKVMPSGLCCMLPTNLQPSARFKAGWPCFKADWPILIKPASGSRGVVHSYHWAGMHVHIIFMWCLMCLTMFNGFAGTRLVTHYQWEIPPIICCSICCKIAYARGCHNYPFLPNEKYFTMENLPCLSSGRGRSFLAAYQKSFW